jgi:flagellar biosynthetic protein FlhB
MSAEDDTEKSHDPSQKRLDDARERGEIAYSADLTTAASYGGFIIVALGFGTPVLMTFGTGLSVLLDQADSLSADMFGANPEPLFGRLFLDSAVALAPWLGVPAAFAMLAVIAQQGLVFAGTKLVPKLSRISPLAALKHKFGLTGWVEFIKSLLKLGLYAAVIGFYLIGRLPELINTVHLSPGLATQALGEIVTGILVVVFLIAATLGVFDLVWQRIDHIRKNRMSRQELIEEMKDSDGDPHVKQQRRQRGYSIAMNQMLADVPKANVVIVNPTHYAVALSWDPKNRRAPVCVAKGTDEIAARIREIAAEHAIPIQSDPPTARALFAQTEIGQEIARDHYRAVAAAIRFADRIRNKAARP